MRRWTRSDGDATDLAGHSPSMSGQTPKSEGLLCKNIPTACTTHYYYYYSCVRP